MSHAQLFNLKQVANLAKISRQRLHTLVTTLRGPPEYTYIGGHPVFDADVVFQWIVLRNKTKQNNDLYTAHTTRMYVQEQRVVEAPVDVTMLVKRARTTVSKNMRGKEQLAIFAASQNVPVNEVRT